MCLVSSCEFLVYTPSFSYWSASGCESIYNLVRLQMEDTAQHTAGQQDPVHYP